MLAYFGRHHGDWYALPYKERELDGRLSEKYGREFAHLLQRF